MTRDETYLAALLHDIGKFIERTKNEKVEKKFDKVRGHPKYSAQLVDVLGKKNRFFNLLSNEAIDAILYHHRPGNTQQKIIQLADWLSSSERKEDETMQERYFETPLCSIFSKVFEAENPLELNYSYPLKPLNLENIFPRQDFEINQYSYRSIVSDFMKEIGKVNDEEQLYYLLQKYLWSVPAQTTGYTPDISLFDHSKTTAAIALCLHDQYEAGELTNKDLTEMNKSKKEQFILINGDVSGIQDFIFNIPSKGAAKSLKGRSIYLNLLSEIVANFLLEKLNLKASNLLYVGGGNFFILAPRCKKEMVIKLREEILNNILKIHGGDIYIAIGFLSFAPSDFEHFTKLWAEVKQIVDDIKRKRWSELNLKNSFDSIFGPLDDGTGETGHCELCGISNDKRKIINFEGNNICTLCQSFIYLTNKVKNANYLAIESISDNRENVKETEYNDIFSCFGFRVDFLEKVPANRGQKTKFFKLNSTEFLDDYCQGFKFGAYNLPVNRQGEQVLFDDLAQESTVKKENKILGDQKLGLLKLDVDNLGAIFEQGFEKNRSISRITALSRMLSLFFEGYINKVILDNGWQDKLYVVYSGGDDTFIVGAWSFLLEFALEFRDKFKQYTCFNPSLSFSSGIIFVNPKFPVVRAAEMAEEALDSAKHYLCGNEKIPVKNKVSIFSEVFNWEEFKRMKNLTLLLFKLVVELEYGHAFLHKIYKSTLGFKKVLADSKKGIFNHIKFWRLAYYLRDFKEEDRKYAEQIIEEYRQIVIHNLLKKNDDEKINNIMIIPAAVRWAQMATRKVKGD